MTKLEPTLGRVNVVFPRECAGNGVNHQYHTKEGTPIRFVPIECLLIGGTGQIGWHGSTWEVYRTKTGKLLCSLTEWTAVDGESDDQVNLVADDHTTLFASLSEREGTAAARVREWLASVSECVLTI